MPYSLWSAEAHTRDAIEEERVNTRALMITNAINHDKSKTIDALRKISNIFIISEIIGDFEIIAIESAKELNSIKVLMNEIKQLRAHMSAA